MPEPFALTCDSCDEPLLPNLSQADADGCLWICIDPDCPELCAGELETEDLVEGGVPKALTARLVRLIDYDEDTIEELHARGAGDGDEGTDAGGCGAPPWPPPRPTSSASSLSSPTSAGIVTLGWSRGPRHTRCMPAIAPSSTLALASGVLDADVRFDIDWA